MSNLNVYQSLVKVMESDRMAALCTIIRTEGSVPRREGAKMLVYHDGRIVGTVGGGELEARLIQRALQAASNREYAIVSIPLVDPAKGDPGVCGGTMDVFIEPVLSEPTVLVVGCGHVGREVAALAKWLGFRVAVSDDRVDFCNPETVPEADIYLPGTIPEALDGFEITDQVAIAAVTRGVKADAQALPFLLESKAGYIGVIGSRRRWNVAVQELRQMGVPDALIQRATTPIGLDIGAETPREIALSIMAEVLAHRKKKDGVSIKWSQTALSQT
ncbi:MAG: XdhC family protein [Anaerolineales bacterium]|nr:XdhC family protein [Anaerolineales bacterium]